MHSLSQMTSDNSNFFANTSSTWLSEGNRKRKLDANDLDEKSQHKMFLTEEKLITNMQTLSLDVYVNNTTSTVQTSQEDKEKKVNQDETNVDFSQREARYELHQLFKDNLAKDNLQDKFMNKLYDLERKKLSMQIVPYMPIHPAQLNNSNNNHETAEEKEQKDEKKRKKESDDHLFKRPFPPTPYIVEEPCENTSKRTLRMKRSYSQSIRYNSNVSVVELKNDIIDYSVHHSQPDYFIFEPSTPVLTESPTNQFYSSLSSNNSSVEITEYFGFSNAFTAEQSNVLSDVNDKMDDDN